MTVTSAAPAVILTGIQDLSIRFPNPALEALPMHLPYVYLFTERGPKEPQLLSGADLLRTYGANTFDYRKPFANHQTVLANTVNAQGNSLFVQRMFPADSRAARLMFSIEVVPYDVPQYERFSDGQFKEDANGNKVSLGTTIPGYKTRWLTTPIDDSDAFAESIKTTGSLEGNAGEVSTVFPIFEALVDVGSHGDNTGIRLSAPTLDSAQPVDDEVITDQEAYLYRIQIVERDNPKSTPLVVQTLFGTQYVEFAFKDDVINKKVDTELSFDKIVAKNYRDVDLTSGFAPVFGPLENMHIYKDNIEEVLTLLHTNEEAVNNTGYGIHTHNFVGAVDWNGNPYYTVENVGPIDGGVLLSDTATHYCQGGADGDMSFDNFDMLVGEAAANFENSEFHLMDDAMFPMSVIYDSGFGIETKKKLLVPMGLRKDIYTVLSTQDVSRKQNTIAEESSMFIALRSAARMYPESQLFGTACCRAIVIGHSGELTLSNYNGIVPMTIDFAHKCARFMGAGNGAMKPGFGYDRSPTNQVTMLKNVNNAYKNPRVRNVDWAAGGVWVQNFDRRSLFYPAVQTVYDEDTSVMNSAINMQIAVELEKVAQRTWRRLTGNVKLTNPQFIERSNELIAAAVANRFDDRVVIVPNTYLTEDDSLRGYSWSCDINMYANNMKTVGTFTVVARRREDLE